MYKLKHCIFFLQIIKNIVIRKNIKVLCPFITDEKSSSAEVERAARAV